jgi:hypothetical protein
MQTSTLDDSFHACLYLDCDMINKLDPGRTVDEANAGMEDGEGGGMVSDKAM